LAPSIKSAIRFAEEAVILSLLIDSGPLPASRRLHQPTTGAPEQSVTARTDADDTVHGQTRHRMSLMCGR
jgi:hypothetical protein